MLSQVSTKDKWTLLYAFVAMVALIISKYSGLKFNFYLEIALAVSAYLPISYEVIRNAFKTLFKRYRMSEEFLMMLATIGAFGLGDFPEALAVMVFYRIGALFEHYAAGKAHKEINSLVNLKPTTVRVINDKGEEEILKPRKVKIGQTIRVLAGEAIGLDGFLKNESALINTSALTGESEPRVYKINEEIPSGCINTSSVIELTVSRDSRNSSITRLLNLIEDATANKSRPEALIRRFATWYTPLVVSAAVLLALCPLVIPNASFSDWLTRALVFLVVSCPCALVLSVPLTFFGGLGALSKIGVLVKGSIHIETMSKLSSIAFDKTGTITQGKFTVRGIHAVNEDPKEILNLAYSLESQSTHPLALGIINYAKQKGALKYEVSNLEEMAGLGLDGIIEGHKVSLGRYEYVSRICGEKIERNDNNGTDIYIVKDGIFLGIIELYDDIKPKAIETFKKLKELNIKTCMITGDKQKAAFIIAQKLNLDKVYAEQLPEDKLKNFDKFKKEYGVSAFVGDGINDAPVLASADIGIAMGQFGSASAVEASDVVIMEDDLSKIPVAIKIAKKTYSLAIQNMYFVILVKAIILLLGALGIANIWLAIFGDVGVLVLSVINAMRTLTFTRNLNS